MKSYAEFSREELITEKEALLKSFSDLKALNLALDMTRGKPSSAQLEMSSHMFDDLSKEGFKSLEGKDCRNYGALEGLKEARELFAEILGIDESMIQLGNSSSLTQMFDTLMRAMVFGELNSEKPWGLIEGRKWLCPAPGYDRHFRITEKLGFELIAVPMKADGPDMDIVEQLAAEDGKILGMWCNPVYSNPDGIVYSEEVCRRIASMKTAAKDFRVYWDNAYVVHHLYEEELGCPEIFSLAKEFGNELRFYEFASTSKISFAGSGLSCMAMCSENLAYAKKILGAQSICTNLVNQLVHTRAFKNKAELCRRMKQHAEILRPKFLKVDEILKRELEGTGAARWTEPKGGYFISAYVMPGTAKRVVALCKELGVALTPAGASYPYGKDPEDSNIRLAPSMPDLDSIEKATEVFALCVKLAAVEKLCED